ERTVQDRSEKRLAEDLIEDLPGVKQVHNRVRVSPASDKDKDKASNEYGSKYNLGKSTSSGRSS
ncbi:MAG TPA: BON domain-containing protein, partial [Thermoanaerobaculia bacterium]